MSRSSVDSTSLGRGVSFPGIDPRCWVTLAIVLDTGVDPESGVYADVEFIPSGDRQCCRVGTGYAGNGYGAWLPLAVDDLVVVLVPRGDPAEGPVVLTRLWSGSDKPPVELGAANGADPPSNPVIVVGAGQTVRVVCRAGATVEVVGDSPASAADPVTLSTPNDSNWSKLADVFRNWTPVPNDDGAALKTLLTSLLAGPPPWPATTAASRLKGE